MNEKKSRLRLQFECPPQMEAGLRALSARTGQGLSEIIREAIAEHLERKGVLGTSSQDETETP